MHIIFHLGPQKTGTTSIQSLLDRNRTALMPKVESIIHPRQTRVLFDAVDAWLLEASETHRIAVEAAVQTAINTASASCETLIVSEEMLVSRRLFSNQTTFVDNCERLIPLLAQSAGKSRCTFVLYYRDFDKWIASAYRQDVKQLSDTRSFAAWAREISIDKDWPSEVRSRIDPEIDLMFIDMAEDAQLPPLGRKLLGLAGLEDSEIDGLKPVAKQNEGLPDGAIAFMREINRLGLGPRFETRVRRVVRKTRDVFKDDYRLE